MIGSEVVRLNMGNDVLKLPDCQELVRSIQEGIEELLQRAPSDSFISLDVLRIGEHFHVDVHLASSVLSFMLKGKARSPFVALERVLSLAWDKLQVWSISKKI
jgi:hypothetical protein